MEELIELLQARLEFFKDEQKIQQGRVDVYTNRLLEFYAITDMHAAIFRSKKRDILKNREVMKIWQEYNKNEILELEKELAELNKELTAKNNGNN